MRKIAVVAAQFIALSFLYIPFATGQEQAEAQKYSTKLEAFQSKSGMIIIRGFTTIGRIRENGSITVDARDFREASNPKSRITGVSITVQESGRLERENIAFIDSDEIESLIAGIDYISKATKDVTSLTDFEVEYSTKGDFKIAVFNNSSGVISAVVSAGRIGKTSAYISMTQLNELRKLILDAKSKL